MAILVLAVLGKETRCYPVDNDLIVVFPGEEQVIKANGEDNNSNLIHNEGATKRPKRQTTWEDENTPDTTEMGVTTEKSQNKSDKNKPKLVIGSFAGSDGTELFEHIKKDDVDKEKKVLPVQVKPFDKET